MIPYDRNPYFLGRDGLLRQLRQKLQETNPREYNHRIAIYGMGGVGKTQLAIEYVYRYEKDYDNIYWISAFDLPCIHRSRRMRLELAPHVIASHAPP
jgi:Cdc6-like AAA superfamily ATPase